MAQLAAGSVIGIPCEVKPGPFSGERLISFKTMSGVITGFVRDSELRMTNNNRWLVRAIVQAINGNEVNVRIRGSFSSTNGLATIPREMAYAA